MSDASKLARQFFLGKPKGFGYSDFYLTPHDTSVVKSTLTDAVIGSAYAATLSYAEAIAGIQKSAISWSIVKLYYSCFYSLKTMLYLQGVIPFHSGCQMMLDLKTGKFYKGGDSSHHWNWNSFRKIPVLNTCWYISPDSQDTYGKLRDHREEVNYTREFTDPDFHSCLISEEKDLAKRIRAYRDDYDFFYTYLENHLAIAYPTRLIFSLDAQMKQEAISLPAESSHYLARLWSMRDRCPLT